MPSLDERGRKVRLRTLVLERLLHDRGWSAHQLHMVAGEPSKRAINRWLARGRGVPDGLVVTQWRYVEAVARALGANPAHLVDGGPHDDDGAGYEQNRFLKVAAALGPRVYPELMDDLGVATDHRDLDELDDYLVPLETQGPPAFRFARWSYCEDLLQEGGGWMPAAFARRAMAWARQVGLGVKEAPELHCLASLTLEDVHGAIVAALEWMRQAMRRGVLTEVIWVGERVLRSIDLGTAGLSSLDVFVETALLQARALRLSGHPERSHVLLTDLALSSVALGSPLLEARVLIELARIRDFRGQRRAALETVETAVTKLEGVEGDTAREHLVQALMDTVYFADAIGDAERSRAAIEQLRRAMRRPSTGTLARFYRMMGISALDRGDLRVSLDHFLNAVDVAEHEGDLREAGIGRLNIALAYRLLDEPTRARPYFEQSVAYVASAGPGPLATAIVHHNFAEFFLEQDQPDAGKRHLLIALAQYDEAGRYPAHTTRCRAMLAEVALAEGDVLEARKLAKAAYQSALVAESALDEALALAVYASAHIGQPDVARSWIRVAEERIASLGIDTMVIPRFGIERRCAEVRFRLADDRTTRRDLERLARRAKALDLGTEQRRLARLLAGAADETTTH